MSIKLMAQIWEIPMPPTQKLVLLALADWANDAGGAWPSNATLARKTGVSESTVHRALWAAAAAGHISWVEQKGKSNKFNVHPCHSDTPVTVTPLSPRHPTPVTVTPHPCHSDTQYYKDTPIHIKTAPTRFAFAKHPDVDESVWNDFLRNRKAKRLANTETAHRQAIKEIDRIATLHRQTPNALMIIAVGKGWGGIYDPWQDTPRQTKEPTSFLDHMINKQPR